MGRKPARAVQAAEKTRRVKVTISLDPETVQRLRALAGFRGCKPRDVLLRALASELSRFVVYERSISEELPTAPPALPTAGPERPHDAPGQARLNLAG